MIKIGLLHAILKLIKVVKVAQAVPASYTIAFTKCPRSLHELYNYIIITSYRLTAQYMLIFMPGLLVSIFSKISHILSDVVQSSMGRCFMLSNLTLNHLV